jgi:hypothetical protein
MQRSAGAGASMRKRAGNLAEDDAREVRVGRSVRAFRQTMLWSRLRQALLEPRS